jgi:hypothetical protein
MRNISCLVILLIVFSSCGRKEKNEELMAKMLNETLVNSVNNISSNNEYIYREFNSKIGSPALREKAPYLKHKMDSIKFLSKNICNYIDSIKSLKIVDWESLNNYLNNSKKIFLSIDESLSREFSSKINRLNVNLDSLCNTKSDSFLKDISSNNQMVILNKLFCDIKTQENDLIKFISFRISVCGPMLDLYSTLVNQNVNHLKYGEELIINAGVGAYSSKAQPQVTIEKKALPVIDGQATYKLKVTGQAGKHTIPVKIVYKDEYDNMNTKVTEIEYTIDP